MAGHVRGSRVFGGKGGAAGTLAAFGLPEESPDVTLVEIQVVAIDNHRLAPLRQSRLGREFDLAVDVWRQQVALVEPERLVLDPEVARWLVERRDRAGGL